MQMGHPVHAKKMSALAMYDERSAAAALSLHCRWCSPALGALRQRAADPAGVMGEAKPGRASSGPLVTLTGCLMAVDLIPRLRTCAGHRALQRLHLAKLAARNEVERRQVTGGDAARSFVSWDQAQLRAWGFAHEDR